MHETSSQSTEEHDENELSDTLLNNNEMTNRNQ